MKNFLNTAATDVPASIVVALVALPLCLGLAHGSNASAFAGLLGGVIGGIVVGALSGSPLSVSGPAAGLTAIVAASVIRLGSWEAFALALMIAGALQIAAGALKLGGMGDYIPNSVIKGMLAAIGVLLIVKQLPHLVGYDADFEGDESFFQANDETSLGALVHSARVISPAAVAVSAASLFLLWLFDRPFLRKSPRMRLIPGPLVIVVAGIGLHELIASYQPALRLSAEHMVDLPLIRGAVDVAGLISWPAFGQLANVQVWKTGLTLAIVASLETLLAVAAVDKLDPYRRVSSANRELVAQGVGNSIAGLLGGLPIGSVIVRNSANVGAGARTRMSTILHGFILAAGALWFAEHINRIPLAAIAAILIHVGYKLVRVQLFRDLHALGSDQFVPFVTTLVAIVFTDLLIGMGIGLGVGLFFLIRDNFKTSLLVVNDGQRYLVRLRKDVSFFTKPLLRRALEAVPSGAHVVIDIKRAGFIDRDVLDVITEFARHAMLKNITLELDKNPHNESHQSFVIEADGPPGTGDAGRSTA